MKIILQKFIAQAGIASRRRAEELIRTGKVSVNSRPAELGMKADENDEVRVGGKRIFLKSEKIYILLNKPVGYVCTNRKFKGEKNIFELVNIKERLFTVGRLDKDSRGLVFLTNDGDLALRLEHPRYGHEKKYSVRIAANQKRISTNHESLSGNWISMIIKKLESGIDIGEGDGIVKMKRIKYLGDNKFELVLAEGKKRQIRRMFSALGYEVMDLMRVSIGSLELGNLPIGKWRYLSVEEVRSLK
jgi:pseudouridine synthase